MTIRVGSGSSICAFSRSYTAMKRGIVKTTSTTDSTPSMNTTSAG